MRPTISEQLRETRRILGDTLLPQLADSYAAQILKKALANLEMLESAWPDVVPFLHWDNQAMAALLGEVEVSGALTEAIGQATLSECEPCDAGALHSRNESLNALVERAIGECGPGDRRRIQAHLLERTARYPMRPKKED